MMKRIVVLAIGGAFLLVLPASHLVFGKAHVPVKKNQVCHNGVVLQVGSGATGGHVAHGDCELPACDFANIFHKGGTCQNVDADGDGKCDLINPRAPAVGTPGCDGTKF